MSDDFEMDVSGFADENEFFEEKKKNTNKSKLRIDMDLDELLKNADIDEDELDNLVSQIANDETFEKMFSDIMRKIASTSTEIGTSLNQIFGAFDQEDDEDENEEESEDDELYCTDVERLNPAFMGRILCSRNNNLYNDFVKEFGSDSTKYFDPNYKDSLKSWIWTDYFQYVNFEDVKDVELVYSDDRMLIFQTKMSSDNIYGFYIAVVQEYYGGFSGIVPEYRNSFKICKNPDRVEWLTIDPEDEMKNEEFFFKNSNGKYIFKYGNIETIKFDVEYMTCIPDKNIIISPADFGTIVPICPSVTKDSDMLQIAVIKANDSAEAILLKKDMEVDINQENFPLYLHFPRELDAETLSTIGTTLYNSINELDIDPYELPDEHPMLRYKELHYTNDGKLYINVDIDPDEDALI